MKSLDFLVENIFSIKNEIITETTSSANSNMFKLITNMLKEKGGKGTNITQKETNSVKKQISLYDDCISFMRCIGTAGVGSDQFTIEGNKTPIGMAGIKKAYEKVMSDFEAVKNQQQNLSKNSYDRNMFVSAVNKCYELFKEIDLEDLSDMDKEEWDAQSNDIGKDKGGYTMTDNIPKLDKKSDFDSEGNMTKKLPEPFKKTSFRKELILAISKLRSGIFSNLIDDVIPDAPADVKKKFDKLSYKGDLLPNELKEFKEILEKYSGKTAKNVQIANENYYKQLGSGKSDKEAHEDRISNLKGMSAANLKAKREEKQKQLQADAASGKTGDKKVASGQTIATYGKIVKEILKKWIEENAPADDNHKIVFYGKIPSGYASAESSSVLGTFTFIPDPGEISGSAKIREALKDIKGLTKFNGMYCLRTSKDFAFSSEELKYVESHASARGNTDKWKIEVQKWLGLKSIVTEENYFNY